MSSFIHGTGTIRSKLYAQNRQAQKIVQRKKIDVLKTTSPKNNNVFTLQKKEKKKEKEQAIKILKEDWKGKDQ